MNDYPTRAQLKAIRTGTGTFRDLWLLVTELWHWPEWGVKQGAIGDIDYLELHTGGWSGNEAIMDAIEKSKSLFFFFYHTKWERGGHYYFEVPLALWDTNPTENKEA